MLLIPRILVVVTLMLTVTDARMILPRPVPKPVPRPRPGPIVKAPPSPYSVIAEHPLPYEHRKYESYKPGSNIYESPIEEFKYKPQSPYYIPIVINRYQDTLSRNSEFGLKTSDSYNNKSSDNYSHQKTINDFNKMEESLLKASYQTRFVLDKPQDSSKPPLTKSQDMDWLDNYLNSNTTINKAHRQVVPTYSVDKSKFPELYALVNSMFKPSKHTGFVQDKPKDSSKPSSTESLDMDWLDNYINSNTTIDKAHRQVVPTIPVVQSKIPGATKDHNLHEKELQATKNRGQQRLSAEN